MRIMKPTAPTLLLSLALMAAAASQPAAVDRPLDPQIQADRPAGWVLETMGTTNVLRYQPGTTDAFGRAAFTSELVTAIAVAKMKSPLPLEKIAFGEFLERCDSLQLHLLNEIESRHQRSLLKSMARPNLMPVQGVEEAPALAPIALKILKGSPDMKEVTTFVEASGYRIKDITWDSFGVTRGEGRVLFRGNVILYLETSPQK